MLELWQYHLCTIVKSGGSCSIVERHTPSLKRLSRLKGIETVCAQGHQSDSPTLSEKTFPFEGN